MYNKDKSQANGEEEEEEEETYNKHCKLKLDIRLTEHSSRLPNSIRTRQDETVPGLTRCSAALVSDEA